MANADGVKDQFRVILPTASVKRVGGELRGPREERSK